MQFDEAGVPHTAVLDNAYPNTVFMHVGNAPASAVQVRSWIWFGDKGATTSNYAFISTPAITIQKRTFP